MATRESDILNAPTAVQRGAAYLASQYDRQKRENALNALIQEFGPVAAMPVEQSQLSATRRAEELQPFEVARQERMQAGAEANIERYGAGAGDPESMRAGMEEITFQRRALGNAANALEITRANGGDILATLNQVANVMSGAGVPQEIWEAVRQEIINDPDGARTDELIATLRGAAQDQSGSPLRVHSSETVTLPDGRVMTRVLMSDGTTNMLEGAVPTQALQAGQRIQQRDRALTNEELRMWGVNPPAGYEARIGIDDNGNENIYFSRIRGSAAEQEYEADAREQVGQAYSNIESLVSTIVGPSETIFRDAERALNIVNNSALFNQTNAAYTNMREFNRDTARGEMLQLEEAFNAIRDNIALERLENMESTLVPVSDADRIALSRSLGNLNILRDRETLRSDLERVISTYQDMVVRSRERIDRERENIANIQNRVNTGPPTGARPPGVSGGAPPVQTPAPGAGAPRSPASVAEEAEEYLRQLGL